MSELNELVEGYDPADPPQGQHWCSRCCHWDDECECDPEPEESNVAKFDREIGLDQESAASWRKRWEAEQLDKAKFLPKEAA